MQEFKGWHYAVISMGFNGAAVGGVNYGEAGWGAVYYAVIQIIAAAIIATQTMKLSRWASKLTSAAGAYSLGVVLMTCLATMPISGLHYLLATPDFFGTVLWTIMSNIFAGGAIVFLRRSVSWQQPWLLNLTQRL